MTDEVDALNAIKSLLVSNWNTANTNNVKPYIEIISETDKRIDLRTSLVNSGDAILIYLVSHSSEPNAFSGLTERTIDRVSIDFRTMVSRSHLIKLYNEARRIIGASITSVSGFSDVIPVSYIDLSDKSRKLWRYVWDVMLTQRNIER